MLARHLGRTDDPIVRQGLARAYEMKKVREWVRAGAAATRQGDRLVRARRFDHQADVDAGDGAHQRRG